MSCEFECPIAELDEGHKKTLKEVKQINSDIEQIWRDMPKRERVCGLMLFRFMPTGLQINAHGCTNLRRALAAIIKMSIEEGAAIPIDMTHIGGGKTG